MTDAAFLRYERSVLETYNQFESLVQKGDAKPLLLWRALLPMLLPITALLIPYRKGGWVFRPILHAITISISIEIIRYRRVLLGANGYMIGLIMVWWLVWSSTLLFFNDAERDFQRIERVPFVRTESPVIRQNGHASRKEHGPNGVQKFIDTLVWQPYPQSFLHRFGWVFALVLTMRGPEFNFRLSSLDPLPPHLDPKPRHAVKKTACPSTKTRLRAAFVRFVVAYLAIDGLKLIMIWDPFFFGDISAPAPFPFDYLSAVPGPVRLYRSLVSGIGVYFALQFVTSLNPLFFLGLSTAFPNAARAITATPLDVPWLYADQFGPLSSILDHGLVGTWGTWWHQIFRFGFVSTAKWLISFFPSTLSSHRTFRRIISTVVAFGISGLMHGTGSYTQIGRGTHPISGTFLFFISQALGIFLQDTFSRIVVLQLTRLGFPPPRWLRRLGNVAFVLVWLFGLGHLIADDFARGGLWLTEPLPISFLRGLMGRGWNCWQTPWFEYYDGGTFWERGVRII
ncbi:membrane bound O-acyl transferase family-domain-containing protein [Aspergillus karnatakaensis]|uniref:wax synthase family protein n=1 Tax=Aspergillus karnatakaensis TaxID=1810916 RepID=UPI003CCD54DD